DIEGAQYSLESIWWIDVLRATLTVIRMRLAFLPTFLGVMALGEGDSSHTLVRISHRGAPLDIRHESKLYLKSAEETLGIEFDCERDFKVTAKPILCQVQAEKSSGCTGGNPKLGTNDPLSSCQSNLEVLHIGAAWEAARSSKQKLKDVVLAVIDTGVDPDHPDLVGQFYKNPSDGSIGYNFIKNNADVNDDNEYGHGTHCAGNAAARTNNSMGIAGVANADAPTPNVKLMILKFLDKNGSGSASDSLRALKYAVEHGATISSHSYGGPSSSAVFEQALKKAAAAGHVAVVAAGNDAANVDREADHPCNYAKNNPSVLCVAASTSSPSSPIKLASFSNAGSTTKIAAPGVDINSTSPESVTPN
ncbi:hypothetical protein FOZ62_025594, partial [Perkinsus olseni]